MEKPGKWFAKLRNCRLLTASVVFLSVVLPGSFAAEVDIFVSSFEIGTGEKLLIEFSVIDAASGGVELEETGIPSSFSLSSGRKERRMKGQTLATVISREWIPSEPGNFSLGPFNVITGGETITLPPVFITVTAPQSPEKTALFWSFPDNRPATGMPLRITLKAVFTGLAGAISCPAPENALLEAIPAAGPGDGVLNGTEAAPVALASWNWTPLDPGWQELPSATFSYTGTDGTARVLSTISAGIDVELIRSPASEKAVPGSVRRAFLEPAAGSGAKTGAGDIAGAAAPDAAEVAAAALTLAALRHDEYTKLFSRNERLKRIALEEKLALTGTLPVPPAAWKPFAVIGSVLAFTAAFLIRLAASRSRPMKALSFTLFCLSGLLVIFAISVYTRDPGPAGVAKGCDLFHIPETGSSVIDILPGGTAVVIVKKTGDWAYVRTVSGLDGWIPSEAIIEYTTENFER